MDVNGVTCIKGEIHSIMTLMRLNSRWAAPARFSRELLIQDESPLVQAFRCLNEYLEDTYDLRDVDCVTYLEPFHQVVISEHASGPLTSAALSSLNKFALYGFLSCDMPRISDAINRTAHCIANCVFEETDRESDEVILVKLLELSSTCLRCDASVLLSVGAAWDIYSTCLSIFSQRRTSKLLRSEAETALRHLTLAAFSRTGGVLGAPSASSSSSAMHVAPRPAALKAHGSTSVLGADAWADDDGSGSSGVGTAVLLQSISTSKGLELFLRKILTVLASFMNPQSYSIDEVKFAMSLVNIALEAGGPSLGLLPSLVDILRGDVCRHLLRISQSDDLEMFSLALRVVFNLFVSIKDHMKVQLEVFLTSVHLRLLSTSNSANFNGASASNNQALISSSSGPPMTLAKEELALESLLEFCREPSLMHDLYTNYDCDVQCTNLFDSIMSVLCSRAQPSGGMSFSSGNIETRRLPYASRNRANTEEEEVPDPYVNILNRLSFEGILLVLHAIAGRCWMASSHLIESSAHRTGNASHQNLSSDRLNGAASADNADSQSGSPRQSRRKNSLPSPLSGKLSTENSVGGADAMSVMSDEEPIEEDEEDEEFLALARSKTAEVLRQRKLKKQKLRMVCEKFNEKSLSGEWIRFASELGLLPPISPAAEEGKGGANLVSAKSLAKFMKSTSGLDKSKIGEFISKGPKDLFPYHAEVLKEYVNTFDFSTSSKTPAGAFVKALRTFLGSFRLPGEAQCIDRLMEAFANRLFEQLGVGNPFASADAAFILSFSTIMLNTDLHNVGIQEKKKMKIEEFIRNNRGINNNADLPQEFLENLYNEIKARQIQVDYGVNEASGNVDMISDTVHWNKLIRRADADQTPASFTPTITARMERRDMRNPQHLLGAVDSSSILNIPQMLHGLGWEEAGSLHSLYAAVTIHDRDMFLVMAEPALKSTILLWETSEDPHLLCKILEGLWEYASVCAMLQLRDEFNKLVKLLAATCRRLVDEGAEHDVVYMLRNNRKPTKDNAPINPEEDIQDLLKSINMLLKSDFESLLMSRSNDAHKISSKGKFQRSMSGADDDLENEEGVRWDGAQYIKAQLLLRCLFFICSKYVNMIHSSGWTAVFRVLLWARRRGGLPESLAEIDDFSDARGGSLPPSEYAIVCYKLPGYQKILRQRKLRKRKGENGSSQDAETDDDEHPSKGSGLWASVAGFLFSRDTEADADRIGEMPVRSQQVYHPGLDPTIKEDELHPLLKTTIQACKVDALLFNRLRDLSDRDMLSVIGCIIDELDGIYRCKRAEITIDKSELDESKDRDIASLSESASSGSLNEYVDSSLASAKPIRLSELDGVLIVEWISRLMFANMHRAYAVWSKLHDFFSLLLERHIEESVENCPYLLERCVVAIVRAAIHMLPVSESLAAGQPSSDSIAVIGFPLVWDSLRLLKGLPADILYQVSDRLGAGLLTLLRGSSECSTIRGVEQWYLIFSLLSSVMAGPNGRPFVWEAVGYLIDNNLINAMNFNPCRHIVLRFLHGVFPTGFETDTPGAKTQAMHRNPWITGSLMHLLRLTFMACGGYSVSHRSEKSISSGDESEDRMSGTAAQGGSLEYCTFPYQDTDDFLLSNGTSISASEVSPAVQSNRSLTVVCVRFTSNDDVNLLLLETIKSFSDFVNSTPLAVSKQSLFCLRAIISACNSLPLAPSMWSTITKEMFSRLPVNLPFSLNKLPAAGWDDESSIELICLKACNTIFETITHHLRCLRPLNEFQSIWLSFISVLAMNINVILETKQPKKRPMLNEYIEMLVALLRFLVPDTKSTPIKPSGGTVGGNVASQLVVLPRSGAASVQMWNTPPQKSSSRLTSYTDAFASIKEDVMLLTLTWRSVVGVCPSIGNILQQSHPYMAEILNREPSDYVYPDDNHHAVAPIEAIHSRAIQVQQPESVDVPVVMNSTATASRADAMDVEEEAHREPVVINSPPIKNNIAISVPEPTGTPSVSAAVEVEVPPSFVATDETSSESIDGPEEAVINSYVHVTEEAILVDHVNTDADVKSHSRGLHILSPVVPVPEAREEVRTTASVVQQSSSVSPRRTEHGIKQIGVRTFLV